MKTDAGDDNKIEVLDKTLTKIIVTGDEKSLEVLREAVEAMGLQWNSIGGLQWNEVSEH